VHTVHRVWIDAPAAAVFALARDIEAWPRLLPSYRWCRVLERAPTRVVFAMGGWVRGWPARWTAVQNADPAEGRIRFEHLRGITKGMAVEWRFSPRGRGVDVEIVHDLVMRWPVIGRLVGDVIIGPIFIDDIAGRTLRALKAHVESEQRRRFLEGDHL
jgi:ribosome-associated toxin RatA of RatAB toxin-antitoxin module